MRVLNWIFGTLSTLHHDYTLMTKGKFVGQDHLGNKYYVGKARKGYKHERRWVEYKNKDMNASNIPPEWHGWMHYQTNVLPNPQLPSYRKDWQKAYIPNMTGTLQAYRPPGHILKGGKRDKAAGDYQAWSPDEL